MLTTNSRRKIVDPARFAVERLEDRLLFAVDGLVTISSALGPISAVDSNAIPAPSTVTEDAVDSSSLGSTVTSTAPTSASAPATTTIAVISAPPGSPAFVEQTDTYLLPAGISTPAIQAELDWTVGASSTTWNLVLSDSSGAILFQSSSSKTSALQRTIFICGTSANPTANYLEVEVTVQPKLDGSADAGTYHFSLQWLETPPSNSGALSFAPVVVIPTGVNVEPSAPVDGVTPVLPPSLSITRSLPLLAFSTANDTATLPVTFGPFQPLPSVPILGGIGTNLGPGVAAAPGSVHPITEAGPRTTPDSVSSTPAQGGYLIPGDRGNPLIVGPLPLGVSAPDGGIFTRTRIEGTSIPPGRGQFGLASGTLLMFGLHEAPLIEGQPAGVEAWPRGLDPDIWLDQPAFPHQARRPRPRSAADDASADPTSAGMAFLPPVGAKAVAERSDSTDGKASARSESRRSQRGNSVVGTLVALAGAVGLVMKLSGPELIRSLRD